MGDTPAVESAPFCGTFLIQIILKNPGIKILERLRIHVQNLGKTLIGLGTGHCKLNKHLHRMNLIYIETLLAIETTTWWNLCCCKMFVVALLDFYSSSSPGLQSTRNLDRLQHWPLANCALLLFNFGLLGRTEHRQPQSIPMQPRSP